MGGRKAGSLVVVCDRGGHLSDAKRLFEKMNLVPDFILTTQGPEFKALECCSVFSSSCKLRLFHMFSWVGNRRIFNPFKAAALAFYSIGLVLKTRPMVVLSFGASNVVFYCFWSWLLYGAKIFHIDCMNQVNSPSITGKLLYPIVTQMWVQWPGLEKRYGKKAVYKGWVL